MKLISSLSQVNRGAGKFAVEVASGKSNAGKNETLTGGGTHRFARETRGSSSFTAAAHRPGALIDAGRYRRRVSFAKSAGRSGGTNLSYLYQASSDGDPTPSLG